MKFVWVGLCEDCFVPCFVVAADLNNLKSVRVALTAAEAFKGPTNVVLAKSLDEYQQMPGFLEHAADCVYKARRREASAQNSAE